VTKRNRFQVVWYTLRGSRLVLETSAGESHSLAELSASLRRAADMVDRTAEAEARQKGGQA
jgi:hypothetical protein